MPELTSRRFVKAFLLLVPWHLMITWIECPDFKLIGYTGTTRTTHCIALCCFVRCFDLPLPIDVYAAIIHMYSIYDIHSHTSEWNLLMY